MRGRPGRGVSSSSNASFCQGRCAFRCGVHRVRAQVPACMLVERQLQGFQLRRDSSDHIFIPTTRRPLIVERSLAPPVTRASTLRPSSSTLPGHPASVSTPSSHYSISLHTREAAAATAGTCLSSAMQEFSPRTPKRAPDVLDRLVALNRCAAPPGSPIGGTAGLSAWELHFELHRAHDTAGGAPRTAAA